MTDPRRRTQLALLLLAAFVAAGAVICVTGYRLQLDDERQVRRAAADQLRAVANTKVEQVVQWREERLSDAASIREDAQRAKSVRSWLAAGAPPAGLLEHSTWLRSFRRHAEYRNILLVGLDGTPVLPAASPALREPARALIAAATRDRRPVMSEFLFTDGIAEPRIYVATPLVDGDTVVASVLFDVDTAVELQRLLRRWPIPTRTAEGLLVQDVGGEVAFLTEPRNAPVRRAPSSVTVSARAAHGERGLLTGIDYRGQDVLAFASAIPQTPWVLVTKVDAAEAIAPARRNAWQVFGIAIALVMALGSSAIVFLERDRVSELRRKLDDQRVRTLLEERLQFVSRGVSDAVLLVGRGTFLDANDRAVELLGYPREALLRMQKRELWANPKERSTFLRDIESHGYAFCETALKRADGSTFPAELTAQTLEADTGLVQVIVRDISERREAERKLLRANRLYAVLSDVSMAALRSRSASDLFDEVSRIVVETGQFRYACVAELDSIGNVRPVARAAAGRPVDDFSFHLDSDASRESTIGRAIAACELSWNNDFAASGPSVAWRARAMETGVRSGAAIPLRRGETVTGALGMYSAEPNFFTPEELRLVDQVGKVLSFALDHFDSDRSRARAEQALAVNEERLRLTLEATNDAMWDIDWKQGTFYMSPRYYTMLGYDPLEFQATFENLLQLIHPDERETVVRGLSQREHEGGDSWQTTFRMRAKDGAYRLISSRGRIVERDGSGRAQRIVGVNTDITETRALEEALRHAQKMEAVGRLAGGVAHDFNNILQAILSMLHVLRVRYDDAAAAQKRIDDLLALVHRGAGLTRQLLLFARREVHDLVRTDLNDILSRSSKMLEHLLRENIRLHVDLAPGPLWVIVDTGQIDQVLMNLVVNAADAMPDGGAITLRTFGEAASVGLEVEDHGTGIPEEFRTHLFEPFFTTKEAGKGTGLGLSVTHGIVQAHRGKVSFESRPGRTVFRVELPAAGKLALAEARTRTPGELPLGRGEHVLLVEDEEPTREGLVVLLNLLRYRVTAVGTGAAALDVAARERFDVLMSDIVLQDVHGDTLTLALREKAPDLPVLLMSGYADDETLRRARSGGRARFLQKPFELDALAKALAELLES